MLAIPFFNAQETITCVATVCAASTNMQMWANILFLQMVRNSFALEYHQQPATPIGIANNWPHVRHRHQHHHQTLSSGT